MHVWKGNWMYEVISETGGAQQLGWASPSQTIKASEMLNIHTHLIREELANGILTLRRMVNHELLVNWMLH